MASQLSLFDPIPHDEQPISYIQELDVIAINKDVPGTNLTGLVPEDATLALTRNYAPRAIHVGRILSLLKEKGENGEGVTRNDLAEKLSMPWASAQGTINVMRKACLLDAKTRITSFGALVLLKSPYLDNQGLLWLLHYLLASNAQLVLWSNLFNFILQGKDEVSIHEAADSFQGLAGKWSHKSLKEKVPKEIGAILHTYSDHFFADLRLITKEDTGSYQIFSNTGIVPMLVWLSTILVYRDRYYPGASSLEVPLMVRAQYSPARILRQNEAVLRRALDELHNADLLTVETRSGLDQVRFKREITWLSAITEHFQGLI